MLVQFYISIVSFNHINTATITIGRTTCIKFCFVYLYLAVIDGELRRLPWTFTFIVFHVHYPKTKTPGASILLSEVLTSYIKEIALLST